MSPPFVSPAGPMAPGWALLVLLVLSPLRACGAELLEPGLPRGRQWVWGVAKPLPLSRGKRDDSGQEPSATTMISSDKSGAVTVSPPAPGSNATLLQVPTKAGPMNDSPEPEQILSSAVPSTNATLLPEPAVSTPADAMNETDPPLVSTPAPSTKASRALVVPTTADDTDETDPPDSILPSTSEPGTRSAPHTSLIEEDTVTDGLDSSSSTGPRSAGLPAFVLTTTGYKKPKKSGAPPAPTLPASWDTTPGSTAVPWEPSGVMSKCLLAILLLGLVAATFVVCTGVLGSLLWQRTRTGERRFSRTEMVCISSLLPDAEAAAGPRPVPARRHKLLLPDGSSEHDGDNLTLSSFLPEHS